MSIAAATMSEVPISPPAASSCLILSLLTGMVVLLISEGERTRPPSPEMEFVNSEANAMHLYPRDRSGRRANSTLSISAKRCDMYGVSEKYSGRMLTAPSYISLESIVRVSMYTPAFHSPKNSFSRGAISCNP